MNPIELYKMEIRPDYSACLNNPKPAQIEELFRNSSVLLYGDFSKNREAFIRLSSKVGWGSVFIAEDATEDKEFDAELLKMDFIPWNKFGSEKGMRSYVRSVYNGDTMGTHWPYLKLAIELTDGPVLELGSGDSSTKNLHDLCETLSKPLVTIDNNKEWADKFRHFEGPFHTIEFNRDPAECDYLLGPWAVVFVDHAPGESRKKAILRTRDKSQYVVVHDTEELGYDMEPALRTFKYRRDFKRSRPWTTVVSMTKEIFDVPGH